MKTIIIDGVEYNLTPKALFKKGDWIINNDKRIAIPTQILKIEEYGYVTSRGYTSFDKVKTDYHLWTIEDANDGDVLKEDSCMFIIEKMKSEETAIVYCCLFDDGDFDLIGSTLSFDVDGTYPATKEQRDLLFSKMKEAGYEWDAEKKELKKIEQNPVWSEEDEKNCNEIIDFFLGDIETRCKTIDKQRHFGYWLKSLKERMKGE